MFKASKAPRPKPGLILILAMPLRVAVYSGLTLAFKRASALCWYGAEMLVNSSNAFPSLISAGKGCWLQVLT